MFKPFAYIPDSQYLSGWDRYALDYAKLPVPGTVYYLTKELIHHMVDRVIDRPARSAFRVLDVNCGTGNDFPFFLSKGWEITGIDGSAGMLNKAAETYAGEIRSGRVQLYIGQIESLDDHDFKQDGFDLIFSVTGGFSYVDDDQLLEINRQLARLLKPGGKIVLAHLNRFCLPESVYRLLKLKNPFLRKGALTVSIKGAEYTMYHRGVAKLATLYSHAFRDIRLMPLLAFTPPYQTGFNPSPGMLKRLKRLELSTMDRKISARWADQVVVVGGPATVV